MRLSPPQIEGHDYAIVALAKPSMIYGFEVNPRSHTASLSFRSLSTKNAEKQEESPLPKVKRLYARDFKPPPPTSTHPGGLRILHRQPSSSRVHTGGESGER